MDYLGLVTYPVCQLLNDVDRSIFTFECWWIDELV